MGVEEGFRKVEPWRMDRLFQGEKKGLPCGRLWAQGMDMRWVVILLGEHSGDRKAQVCMGNSDQDGLTKAGDFKEGDSKSLGTVDGVSEALNAG